MYQLTQGAVAHDVPQYELGNGRHDDETALRPLKWEKYPPRRLLLLSCGSGGTTTLVSHCGLPKI